MASNKWNKKVVCKHYLSCCAMKILRKVMKGKPSYSRKELLRKVPKEYHSESEMERNKEPKPIPPAPGTWSIEFNRIIEAAPLISFLCLSFNKYMF